MGYHKSSIQWLASPLLDHEDSHDSSFGKEPHHSETSIDPEGPFSGQEDDIATRTGPHFQRHEETTNIELFFDLFFVANLTTFTGLHEINNSDALKAYIGYFCILWFAWCQVIMFDVRYVTDSIVARMAKAVQFGVMVSFAVVGPNFNPEDQKQQVFKTLSIILAVSRFILFAQYLIVMWHVKKFKGAKLPLGLIAGSNLVAGVIYMALAFTFPKQPHSHNYIAWYVVAVVETAFIIAVSSRWKVVSFKGTHLIQRMSLLTLIILGEGIIVVCKSIAKIVKNQNAWTSPTIGTLTAAATLIYLLYMIYFDWLPHKHFGSIRQQIWAFLHFPFHLALVLFMEGTAQFLIWHKVIEALNLIGNTFLSKVQSWEDDPNGNFTTFIDTVNGTVNNFLIAYPPVYANTYDEIDVAMSELVHGEDENTLNNALVTLIELVESSLFTTYGIEAPETKGEESSIEDELNKQAEIFNLVFIYFFATAGLTLIILNILHFLSITHKSSGKLGKTAIFRLVFNMLVGIALCLLALFVFNGGVGADFAMSAWVLPTPTIGLFLVLLTIHIKWPTSGLNIWRTAAK